MKKLIFKILLLTLVVFVPVSAMAGVSVRVNIPLPPPIIFPAPPEVVVIPQTNVYTVPDVQEEIFFYGGWWWRPWDGHWYRSRYYDRGWGYYRGVPSFHRYLYAGWRDDFRHNRWRGQPWQYNRIHHNDFHNNWRNWERNKHWERQNSRGVKGLPPKGQPQRDMNRPQQPGKDNHQPGHGPDKHR